MSDQSTTARVASTLDNPVLAAEMKAARENDTLVNGYKVSDGREILVTTAEVAVALPDGRIQRAVLAPGLPVRLLVVAIITEPVETMGGLL